LAQEVDGGGGDDQQDSGDDADQLFAGAAWATAAGMEEEAAGAPAASITVEALDKRPESESRLRRARSVRRSVAL
jgi:hypothetical protein